MAEVLASGGGGGKGRESRRRREGEKEGGGPRYEKVQGDEVLTAGAHSGGWWSWSRGTPTRGGDSV